MIAVVVPTIRNVLDFQKAWQPLFSKHKVRVLIVHDGDKPILEDVKDKSTHSVRDVMGKKTKLIYNKNDGVRNLGFAYIAKYLHDIEYIITLDDDVLPVGDTIEAHINVLNSKVPITWFSVGDHYTRGFPYKVREESPVALSHGVWTGVADWDAPTQLVLGNPKMRFYVGPIPRGCMFPMCGMNVAFRKEMLPHMYWAPMGPRVKLDRFADIWAGTHAKRVLDIMGWAAYTGGAVVRHERASNVWRNLQKEAVGLEMNEFGLSEEYAAEYSKAREDWRAFIYSKHSDLQPAAHLEANL